MNEGHFLDIKLLRYIKQKLGLFHGRRKMEVDQEIFDKVLSNCFKLTIVFLARELGNEDRARFLGELKNAELASKEFKSLFVKAINSIDKGKERLEAFLKQNVDTWANQALTKEDYAS